ASRELYRDFLQSNSHLDADTVSISDLGVRIDAVLTAALALNRTLRKYAYSTELDLDESPFKDQLLSEIRAVDFEGFTGRVKLDGNGDRLANAVVYQIRNFESVAVAFFNTYDNIIDWSEELQFSGKREITPW
uniref:ANF_receptor domain-containing protein n=1 Tax=Macrostomum lignano TaxID=282301 RepID=A0A1I8GVQ7_9PLAT